jgi:mannosyltransferase OCH1-like enzyme
MSLSSVWKTAATRFTKIYGNCSKPFSYLFYLAWPEKRFSIPHSSGPLLNLRSRHRIPKIIWQTNYTDRVTIAVYLNYLFNRLMGPSFEYRFMDSAERLAFIRKHCAPEILECYSKLQIGASQADLWRVLVLREFGGVYLDIDAHLAWPLGFTLESAGEELFVEHRGGELSNYFMASVRGNPRLGLIIDTILDNVRANSSNNVFELTGPSAVQRALRGHPVATAHYRRTCYQGSFTNEFFQYVDHPQGKWNKAQDKIAAIVTGQPEARTDA